MADNNLSELKYVKKSAIINEIILKTQNGKLKWEYVDNHYETAIGNMKFILTKMPSSYLHLDVIKDGHFYKCYHSDSEYDINILYKIVDVFINPNSSKNLDKLKNVVNIFNDYVSEDDGEDNGGGNGEGDGDGDNKAIITITPSGHVKLSGQSANTHFGIGSVSLTMSGGFKINFAAVVGGLQHGSGSHIAAGGIKASGSCDETVVSSNTKNEITLSIGGQVKAGFSSADISLTYFIEKLVLPSSVLIYPATYGYGWHGEVQAISDLPNASNHDGDGSFMTCLYRTLTTDLFETDVIIQFPTNELPSTGPFELMYRVALKGDGSSQSIQQVRASLLINEANVYNQVLYLQQAGYVLHTLGFFDLDPMYKKIHSLKIALSILNPSGGSNINSLRTVRLSAADVTVRGEYEK